MKVKALDSFAGKTCMTCGEIRELDDDVAKQLIKHGRVEEVKQEKPARKAKK